MTKLIFSCVAYALVSVGAVLATGSTATAQTAILNEMYGRGVHEYYAGDYSEAYDLLSSAIDNGIEDPRAYYFRGIVAQATGRPEQAEADWQAGAQLEAAGKIPGSIGRALSRYQGPERLKLEEIRHEARLQALSEASQRRQQRYGAPQGQPSASPQGQPAGGQAQQPPQPRPQAPVAPPPAPPAAAADNPFADDVAAEPEVQSQDALEGAEEAAQNAQQSAQPAAGQQPDAGGEGPFGAGDAPAGGDPFGGDAPAEGDPFGGDAGGGDAESDPFGGDGGGDPFGGDGGNNPFGGGSGDGGEMENPFG